MLPALIMLLVFARLGVAPFGDRTLLVADMDNEYIDYFAQMNKIAREQGSFLRSRDMGMGLNMLGLIAFYTASPLNVLLLLWPVDLLTEGVLLLTLVKFGLCGVFFSIFADRALAQGGAVNLLFSVSYALIGYNLAYASNLMWLDGVAFLPLVLLGVERILREDRYLGFALSLIWVFVSSYYIGYMVGCFAFLYFTARFFAESGDWRRYLGKLWRLLLGAALAAGCCMALLLPAFLNLRDGQETMFLVPRTLSLERSFVDMAAKLLPGVYDSLTDSGMPNIYLGTGGTLLCALYFFNRSISRRERLVMGGLLLFVALSFSSEFLYLGWHAFEDPTWFPARFSFVFSFLALYLGLRGVSALEGISLGAVLGAVGILLLLYVEVGIRRLRFVRMESLLLAVFLLLVFAGLLLAARGGARRPAILGAALLLVLAELHYNAAGVIAGIDSQFTYRSRESYYGYRETYLPAVELVEGDNPGVYRIEVLEQRNANGGMALGYQGISHYSTTTDQALNSLLAKLGYNTGLINELRFAPTTPLTNGLLGIRFVLASGEIGAGYDLVDVAGKVGVYENTLAFPLAYLADGGMLAVDAAQPDPFALQNEIVAALGAERAFYPLEVVEEHLQNLEKEQLEDRIVYTRRARAEPAAVEFEIENPYGMEAYAYLPVYGNRFARATVYVDGIEWGTDLSYRHNTLIALGAGERVSLRVELEADTAQLDAVYLYALDEAAALAAAEAANRSAMEFLRWTDRVADGVVRAEEAGVLVTTIPYDAGWRVRIDGAAVEPQRWLGVFLAVELDAGEHLVEMRYSPPGFRAGVAVSVLSVAGLVFWCGMRRRGRFLRG